MRKISLKSKVEIEICGVNLDRLVKKIFKNEIDIFDISRLDHKKIKLKINSSDLKKIKPLLENYSFKIVNFYGFSFLKQLFLKRVGLFAGVILFFVAFVFNNNYLSNIYVFGNERILDSEIKTYLKSENIKQNSFFLNLDVEKIESALESNFNEISLVSVMKKGTTLIINIKEKIDTSEILDFSNLVAPNDGKILSFELISGTANFSVGDSVKKGDVLVFAHAFSGEEKTQVKAIAKIEMQIWYKSSVNFFEEERVSERTGKTKEVTNLSLFGKNFKIKNEKIDFENYEIEEKSGYLFNNFFIPIKFNKKIYYEIKENLIKNDFSLQKNEIIDKIRIDTLKLVPKNVEAKNVTVEVSEIENGKIISCYVETIQHIE